MSVLHKSRKVGSIQKYSQLERSGVSAFWCRGDGGCWAVVDRTNIKIDSDVGWIYDIIHPPHSPMGHPFVFLCFSIHKSEIFMFPPDFQRESKIFRLNRGRVWFLHPIIFPQFFRQNILPLNVGFVRANPYFSWEK